MTRSLELYLESLATAFIEAVNASNFDDTAFPWPHMHPKFVAQPTNGIGGQTRNKRETIDAQREYKTAHPEYNIVVLSCSACIIMKGRAQTFMVTSESGSPGISEGIGRAIVVVLDWEMFDGEWYMVAEKCMAGFHVDRMGAETYGQVV